MNYYYFMVYNLVGGAVWVTIFCYAGYFFGDLPFVQENQADDVYEFFITKLFEEEKDCIELIKIKEIMHELEKTTDAAEHVGKILKSLIVKYA
jgi:hypothetical protein